jgi:HEAT repeats
MRFGCLACLLCASCVAGVVQPVHHRSAPTAEVIAEPRSKDATAAIVSSIKQQTYFVHVDQHVFTMKDDAVDWDGSWKNDPFGADRGLGVADGVITAVALTRAGGQIPVFVEVHDGPPPLDDVDLYHAVLEASVHVPSHVLSLENESGSEAKVKLPSAHDHWRLRYHHANADLARYDYADGAEHVRVALFPGEPAPVLVHKPAGKVHDDPVPKYRGKRTEPQLRAMLAGSHESHRCIAAVALVQLGRLDVVLAAAESSLLLRRIATSALGIAGAPAVGPLAELATHSDADVRLRAAQSLEWIGTSAVVPVLERLRTDDDARVRAAAEYALETLATP